MAELDYPPETYDSELNRWHLELAMLHDLVAHIFDEMDGPEWATSAAHIAEQRFHHLVESCPFPSRTSAKPS